jgi:XTP/dITP diphosphohydrolase
MAATIPIRKLLLGTGNRGKLAEMRELLSDLQCEFVTLKQFPQVGSVEETGNTYEENAVLKARAYSRQTGLWTIADDSGLEVDALGKRPGVLSARYAGASATDSDRISLLLEELRQNQGANRSARFICVTAIANPVGELANVAHGVCEGTITETHIGNGGFGYDPVFVPRGYQLTFGTLSADVKNAISHRALALKATRDFLTKVDLSWNANLTTSVFNS